LIIRKFYTLLIVWMFLLVVVAPAGATEKTFQMNITGCGECGPASLFMWVRSILRNVDGVIRVEATWEDDVIITFNDQITNEEKIAQALLSNGLTIQNKEIPVAETHLSGR
jgi:copper chaperone CopZ